MEVFCTTVAACSNVVETVTRIGIDGSDGSAADGAITAACDGTESSDLTGDFVEAARIALVSLTRGRLYRSSVPRRTVGVEELVAIAAGDPFWPTAVVTF